MEFSGPMYVVKNIERSKQFYKEVMGLCVTVDFGENITLTGGFSLQECALWCDFIHEEQEAIQFGGKNAELYFEETDFDAFVQRLKLYKPVIPLVHDVKEHAWGQRVIRFYDPDQHIIEVGEPLDFVCKRFLEQGLSIADICTRTGLTKAYEENVQKKGACTL